MRRTTSLLLLLIACALAVGLWRALRMAWSGPTWAESSGARDGVPDPAMHPGAEAQARIVVLSPAIGVILRDLGYADQIVARHAFDHVLEQALPACGDQAGVDYECLLRARPTHVFTQWGARELPERLRSLAQQHHWTLRDLNFHTLSDIASAVQDADMAMTGAEQPSMRALELAMRLESLAPKPDKDAKGLRVLMILSTSPTIGALGAGSCHDELLRGAGARNALEGSAWARAYVELTSEDVLALAPEAILYVRPRSRETPSDEPVGMNQSDPWQSVRRLAIPAVRDARLEVIDDPLGLLPSTAMIGLGERMGAIVRTWNAMGAGKNPVDGDADRGVH